MIPNTEITCPCCNYTYVDEDGCTAATDEKTHIDDHGRCWDCQKKWTVGELDE